MGPLIWMKTTLGVAGLFIALAGCNGKGRFYSHSQRAFVPLAEVPYRRHLVGDWQGANGRMLLLAPDGRLKSESGPGCWDVDGGTLVILRPCSNYGAVRDGPFRPLAQAHESCAVSVGADLQLRDCRYAGAYVRVRTPQ